MFDSLTFNWHSIVNKFTGCMNSDLIFLMNRCFFRYESMKSVKNQDKSITETISTNWSIQSIYESNQIYRFLSYRFIDWEIDRWAPGQGRNHFWILDDVINNGFWCRLYEELIYYSYLSLSGFSVQLYSLTKLKEKSDLIQQANRW